MQFGERYDPAIDEDPNYFLLVARQLLHGELRGERDDLRGGKARGGINGRELRFC